MHAADRYALLSQEIEQLEIERKKVRAELLAMKLDEIHGAQATVFVGKRTTITLNPKDVYDALKPSRFFQMVSVKTAEAAKFLTPKQFEQAITKKVESDVVTYDVSVNKALVD